MALLAGAVVGMADATLVAVALDPLSRHFGQPLAASQQVIALYLVTVTATLPLLGRLGDRLGRRDVYAAGFVIFAAGSVVAAAAPAYSVLLAGRAVEALGGAMLTSGSLALVAQWAQPRRTGRAVALLVAAQAGAGLVGPPFGGLLVALWGWQAVFWVGLPTGLAGLALTLWAIPRTRATARDTGIDPLGAAGLAALLLGAGSAVSALGGVQVGGAGATTWLAVALAGACLLAVVEPRAAHPAIDRGLLRGRFLLATVATLVSTGALMTCFALLPFWLEAAHGASAALAGAALLPVGIGIGGMSAFSGRLGDRGHTRGLTAIGMGLAAAGLGVTALAARSDAWGLLIVGLLVLGLGNGLFSSPNTASAMAVAPRNRLGAAAALLSTARNAGVVVGLGIVGALYSAGTTTGGAARADDVAALIFAGAGILCLAVAGLANWTYRPVAAS